MVAVFALVFAYELAAGFAALAVTAF